MASDWRDRAACWGADPDLFFPLGDQGPAAEQRRVLEALAICKPCPVRMECLRFAVLGGERGIWGGMTEKQRRGSRLCKNMRALAC